MTISLPFSLRLRAWAALFLLAGCGYRPVYGGEAEPLRVKVVRVLVPDAVASDEVASGVREALARGGLVEAGDAYPRV